MIGFAVVGIVAPTTPSARRRSSAVSATIRRSAATAAAAAALLVTAACTDDSSPEPSEDWCGRLSIESVTELFGQEARLDQSTDNDCVWTSDAEVLHQLSLQRLSGSANYDPDKWGGLVEPLTGLGDEAFLVRTGPFGVTGGYLAEDVVVYLNYQVLRGGPSPTDKAEQIIDMLRMVAGPE